MPPFRKYLRSIGFILFLLFAGCESDYRPEIKPPADLISEDVYLQMLTELQLYNAWVSLSDTLNNPDSLKLAIFTKYDVSEPQFSSSHRYYQSDFTAQNTRIDSVLKLLDAEKKRINQESTILIPEQMKPAVQDQSQ